MSEYKRTGSPWGDYNRYPPCAATASSLSTITADPTDVICSDDVIESRIGGISEVAAGMKKAAVLLSIITLAIVLSLSGCGGKKSSSGNNAHSDTATWPMNRPNASSSMATVPPHSATSSSAATTTPSPAPYDNGNNSYTIYEEQTYQEGYGLGYDEGYDAYSQYPDDPSVPEAPNYEDYFGELPEESGESIEDVQEAFAAGWEAGYEDGWNDAAAEDEGSEYEY